MSYEVSIVKALASSTTSSLEFQDLKPMPKRVESSTDDPSLQNPLERLERMGTGWFGVILDFEGVVIQDAVPTHINCWLRLAEETSKPRPLESSLLRAAPMKAEQAISEVLCWGRDPQHIQKIAKRKEQLFAELTQNVVPATRDGLVRLLETLKKHNIPVAVCSNERQMVCPVLKELELEEYIDVVISANDVGRCAPDPEALALAAQRLQRPPTRCVVIGSSNQSCEAAHDCGMMYVAAVTGTRPLYELNAADLVIKHLDEISIVNLKQLFRHEEFKYPAEAHDGMDLNPEPRQFPE